jgi:hypothetical protein
VTRDWRLAKDFSGEHGRLIVGTFHERACSKMLLESAPTTTAALLGLRKRVFQPAK